MNKVKTKIIAILLVCIATFSTNISAKATDFGERPVPSTIGTMYKTTTDNWSYVTLGDVSFYSDIIAYTVAKTTTSTDFIRSNPDTLCSENSTTYLGRYVGFETYIGQPIKLRLRKTNTSYNSYYAEVDWDYR